MRYCRIRSSTQFTTKSQPLTHFQFTRSRNFHRNIINSSDGMPFFKQNSEHNLLWKRRATCSKLQARWPCAVSGGRAAGFPVLVSLLGRRDLRRDNIWSVPSVSTLCCDVLLGQRIECWADLPPRGSSFDLRKLLRIRILQVTYWILHPEIDHAEISYGCPSSICDIHILFKRHRFFYISLSVQR
jgi:hypothetical protein